MTSRSAVVATAVAAVALILGVAAESGAQSGYPIKIAFADGRVSLVAEEAPASEVLAEWSRVGRTEILGAELVEKRLVTLNLEDWAEGEAIEAIIGKGFGFAVMLRALEPGLSTIQRLVVGTSLPLDEQPVDPSIPPEARFAYYVPEKVLLGEDFGKPEYMTLKELPPAPEMSYAYYTPEKAYSDFGRPVYEPIDPRWTIPESRFEYFLKDFPKFDVAEFVRTPTTYPEVRFTYYHGPKAIPW